VTRVKESWERFWFKPESTAPIELFRIGFGVVMTGWVLSLLPTLMPFFGPRPALPESPNLRPGMWTVFTVIQGSVPAIWAFWVVALVATVCVTVGYRTRIAAVIVLVVLISVNRQIPLAFNAGDVLLRVLAFYLVLSPAGTAVSVDRWRRHRDRFWVFPRRSPWAMRLLQIQLSVIYLSTVWDKVQGSLWQEGTAVSYALRVADVGRLPTPAFVTDSVVLSELMTFGTLAAELSIGLLVWNRTLRPWVLGLGVALHLGIEVQLAVGFFSLAMLTLYLVFVSPARAEGLLRGAAERAGRVRYRLSTRRATPGHTTRAAEPERKTRTTTGSMPRTKTKATTKNGGPTKKGAPTRTGPIVPSPRRPRTETPVKHRVPDS